MKETLKDIFINNPQYDDLRSTAIGGTLGGLTGGLYGYFKDYDHYKDLDEEEEKDERLKSALLHTGLGTGTGILSGMVFDLQPRYFLGYDGYKDYLKTLKGVSHYPGRRLNNIELQNHWNENIDLATIPGLQVLQGNTESAEEFVGNGPAYITRAPKKIVDVTLNSLGAMEQDPDTYLRLVDTAQTLHALFPKTYPTVEAAAQSLEWSNKLREELDDRNIPSFKPVTPGIVAYQYGKDSMGPHTFRLPVVDANVEFLGVNQDTPQEARNQGVYTAIKDLADRIQDGTSSLDDEMLYMHNGFSGIPKEKVLNFMARNGPMPHEVGHIQSSPNAALVREFYKSKIFNNDAPHNYKSLYKLLQGSYPSDINEYTRTFDLIHHYANSLGLDMNTSDLSVLKDNYKKAFIHLLQNKSRNLPVEHRRLQTWVNILKNNLNYDGIHFGATPEQLFDVWFSTLPNESLPSIGYGNASNLQRLLDNYL